MAPPCSLTKGLYQKAQTCSEIVSSSALLSMAEKTSSTTIPKIYSFISDYSWYFSGMSLALSRRIANCIDPEGAVYKRNTVKRFLTIVLPDNVLFLTWPFLSIQPSNISLNPNVLIGYLIFTVGLSVVSDYSRWIIASVTDLGTKLGPKPIQDFVNNAFIKWIAPRDFFAKDPPRET